MPKNTQTININFDASMDIAQVKAAVSAIEKSFSGIKLPQGLFNRLTTDLQKLQDELTNFSSLSSNMKNLSDIGKSEKSLEKITSLYRRLQLEISEIDGLDPKKLLPDSIIQKIGKVEKAFSSYQSSITEIGKEADATKKKIEKLLKLKTEHRQLASTRSAAESRKREVEAELPGAQARATIAKETTAAAKKSGVDINSQQYLELVEAQKQAENEAKSLNDELKRLQSTISSSTTSLQKNEEAQKQFSDITETFGTKIKDLKQAFDTMGQTQAAAALQKLKEQLSQIDGFDVSNLKDDLSNLDDLTEGLSAEALRKIENGLKEIKKNSGEAERGIESMDNALGETAKSGEELTRTANEVERLKEQVFDFFSIGNSIELFKKSVRSAFDTVKELDKAMTETAVVTDFTIGDMWSQLPQYSEMANRLGTSILGAYEATTLYYQQGLKTNEVMAVSNETLKMARIAGMDAADATDLMTAALRGFNMEINEGSAQRINDVYSELAAVTAADTQEIGVAMSKTASIAASANMEFETTAALLSQIIETTREAPETAGTAMKTIIARFTEVKTLFSEGQLTGTDTEGEEININKIDEALKTVGISLKDFLNGTKGIDDIFLELASKWDTLDIATQRYIATTAAGSRQQSRFLAMMSNYDRTMELVDAAYNSTGASQEQFNKTLDSMESKLAQLKNAWDQFTMGLANNEILKFGVELLTSILTTVNKLIEALSGGNGLTKSFLSLVAALISLRTGKGILHKIFGGESGGLLEGLLGKKSDIKGQSEKAGRESAFAFISSFKKGGKREGKNLFSEIFTTEQTGKALEKTQKHFSDLFSRDLDKANLTEEQKVKIIAEYDSGNFDAAIAQAKEYGVVIESDTEKAKVFAQSSTINMNAVAVSAGLVGLAFSGIGSALEEAGNTDAARVFQNIGNALMGISAVLPLLSAGAKALGVSFTRAGVQIGAAGQVAQLGWGWISLILGGVTALIGGAIAIAKAIHANSLEGRMEAAAEATANAKESAESAKQAYDDLLSSHESYNELQNNLEDLTRGTLEWKQALAEANQQVLELLSTYPELAKYIERGNNNQLVISNEGWEAVIKKQEEAVTNTSNAVIGSQLVEQSLQREKAEEDRNSAIKATITRTDHGYSNKVSTKLDDKYVEGLYKAFSENPAITLGEMNEQLKAMGSTAQLTEEQMSSAVQAFAEYDSAIAENDVAVQGLTKSLLTSNASEDLLGSELSDNMISAFSETMGSNFDEQVNKKAGEIYQKNGGTDESIKERMEDRGLISKITNDDLKNLQILYADMAEMALEEIPADLKDSKDALAKKIAKIELGKEYSENMESFYEQIKGSAQAQESAKQLMDVLAKDSKAFSEVDLAKMAEMDPTQQLEQMAISMGFTTDETSSAIEKLAKALGKSVEELTQSFTDSIADIQKEQAEVKSKLGVQMLKSGAFGNSQDVLTALNKMSEEQRAVLESALEKTTGTPLEQEGQKILLQQMPDISLDEEAFERVQILLNNTNFNNPIDSAIALGEAAQDANDDVKKLANGLLEAGGEAYSSGAQFKYFIQSADFSDIDKELDKFIEETGEISASNIKELAKENSTLNKMLGQGKINAQAMAKALAGIKNGSISMEGLTSRVLEAVSSVVTLDDVLEDVHNTIENFDPGFDAMEGMDFLTDSTEKIQDFIDNMEFGNPQLQNYIRQIFGADALEGLSGDALISKIQELQGKLKTWIAGDGYGFWEEVAKGTVNLPGVQAAFDKNGDIVLDVAGKTTEQMVKAISDGAKVSEDTARMLLTNYMAHSADLAQELGQNDFNQQIKELLTPDYNVGVGGKSMWVMSSEEVQAFAQMTGKTFDEIQADLSRRASELGGTFHIADWFDDTGALLKPQQALQKINDLMGGDTEWVKSFIVNADTADAALNVEELQKHLDNLGVPEELRGDIINSIKSAAEESAGQEIPLEATVTIPKTGADGITTMVEEKVRAADMSSLTSAVDAKLEAADYNLVAQNIVNQDLTGLKDSTNKAIAEGAAAGAAAAQTSVNNISVPEKTMVIKPVLKPGSTINVPVTTSNVPGNAKGTGPQGFAKNGASLVGEEAPEIIQTKDGAYLAGLEGPEVVGLEKGDIVYNGEETEKILSSKRHPIIERYATGKWNVKQKQAARKDKSRGSSSGSSNKGKEQEESWENPYDWLYNLTEDINENLREREKLERRYDRILRDRKKTAKDLYDNIKAQTENLKEQERLQEQMLSKRRKEMADFLADNSDLSKYGTFNWEDNTIEINWDLIDSVKNTDEGEAIEEYISRLEEIQDNMDDAEDALDEIVDQIYELQQIGKDEFDDLESRTLDALIQRDQEAIDKLSNINDSINNANQKLLDSVQKNLDQIRQDRQNEETEQNLAEKERQLAYLRQDTSGANAMQIRQLEEELANEQESYTDTLIDQKISELQQQNDEAAEQRERQIELAQAQLDYAQENGLYWQEAHKIMQEGVNAAGALIKGSELVSILGSAEGWDAMSEIQQMNWLSQLEETSKQALQYFAQQRQLENIGKKSGSITFTNANGQTLTGTVQSDGSVKVSTGSGTYTYKDVYQNYDGTYRTLEGQSDASYVANKPATPPPSSNTGSSSGSYYRATPYRGYSIVDGLKAIGEYTASEYKNRKKIAAANGIKNYTGSASQNTQMLRLLQQGKLKKYAKGGLVDTTGLAWLDGTASNPEMVLRAKDTENFIQLKNILAEVLKGKENAISERSGDNYFEIYIEVDSLGNDYDVEQLAGKIKRMINEDARYRNVNAINILR